MPQLVTVECHPCHQQRELRSYLKAHSILLEAWYPLGHGDRRLLEEPAFVRLAKSYGKTPAQTVLRWQYRWALPSSPARRILPILPRMPIYSILAFHLRDGRDSSARWKEALLPPKPDKPSCLSHDASRLRRSEIASGPARKPAKEHWTCIPEGHASTDRHAKKMPAPHERRRHQTMDYERSSTP